MLEISSLVIKETRKENQLVACCPFCYVRHGSEDVKFHLGINLDKNVYHCFRCGASGTINKTYSKYNRFVSPDESLKQLKEKLLNPLINPEEKNFINLDYIGYKINKKTTPMSYRYLEQRGLTEEIETFNLHSGIEYEENGKKIYKWCGRILFPFFDENKKCVFVVGRSYTGAEPKYLNSAGSKSRLLFNLSNLKEEEPVILCEGIISAIYAQKITGVKSVAMLGKTITWGQLYKLRGKTSEIFLCLDGDTTEEEQSNILKKLIRFRFRVFQIKLPLLYNEVGQKLKDPDDHKEIFLHYFKKAQRVILV